ncbi:peptidase [Noviherbaspirillum cavernae]|uniref:Peptidase n=1 Tax=Noviherbaspirillum cavernae TaxID=2320862 RepID=A0A418WXL1_9BURK|nr:M48 family metallopeptidase [Noviherbaspirillum cavernae]RJG04853.1 peptidase [Noviherbaspirillum cavernae]
MNFFEHQHQARRQTRTLIILFVLAVIAIVIAVNVAMTMIWSLSQGGYSSHPDFYPKGFFATNTLVTLALIGVGTLIETFNLRDGGEAVAKMAGGRLVSPASQDLQERRLLNVVEEMAIAAGIACPRVYVLDKEDAINAFAAGHNQNEAVVAVTRGTLNRLTRDELQGVVAHEFSHILNGDMRLNIHLISVLFGIQMIAGFGQHLMHFGARVRTARDSNDKGLSAQVILLAIGFALFVIGYIGIIFGRLIKSAVSRQREFLADASAVQFTRNADGIGGALRKIGGLSRTMESGSRIRHPNAEQLSHLFLGAPRPVLFGGWFSTHPPMKERLRRIYGRHVEPLDAPEMASGYAGNTETLPDIPYVAAGLAASDASLSSVAFGNDAERQEPLPQELASAVREPQAACCVVYALLLGSDDERRAQFALLQADMPQRLSFIVFLADAIARLPQSARLPLLDLAMPALKQLKGDERAKLLTTVDRLIAADNRIVLAEFVLQTVLTRRLGMHAGRATPIRYNRLGVIRDDCVALASLLAHVAASAMNEMPAQAFMRGAAHDPELGLSAADLVDVRALGFERVKTALDHANELAPLVKPALIKLLLAIAGGREPMPVALADLLRAICAAIDAPIPPAVAATYTAYHW